MTKTGKLVTGGLVFLVIVLVSTALNGVDDTLKLVQGLSEIVGGAMQ